MPSQASLKMKEEDGKVRGDMITEAEFRVIQQLPVKMEGPGA